MRGGAAAESERIARENLLERILEDIVLRDALARLVYKLHEHVEERAAS